MPYRLSLTIFRSNCDFSMLPMQEKERVSEQQFADEIRFQSALCKDAMKRLTGENIISCYADGTIRPEGTVTKARIPKHGIICL